MFCRSTTVKKKRGRVRPGDAITTSYFCNPLKSPHIGLDLGDTASAAERASVPGHVDIVQYYAKSVDDTLGFKSLSLQSAKPVAVTSKILEKLDMADRATCATRSLLRYGAGNQLVDIAHSNGESFARVAHLRRKALDTKRLLRHQAGNCGEFAYLTFNLLASQRRTDPVSIAQWDGLDHNFVILGDPREKGPEHIVVADAWVNFPIAHTLRHNGWFEGRVLSTLRTAVSGQHHNPDHQVVTRWSDKTYKKSRSIDMAIALEQLGDSLWDTNFATTRAKYFSLDSTSPNAHYYSYFPKAKIEDVLAIEQKHFSRVNMGSPNDQPDVEQLSMESFDIN